MWEKKFNSKGKWSMMESLFKECYDMTYHFYKVLSINSLLPNYFIHQLCWTDGLQNMK